MKPAEDHSKHTCDGEIITPALSDDVREALFALVKSFGAGHRAGVHPISSAPTLAVHFPNCVLTHRSEEMWSYLNEVLLKYDRNCWLIVDYREVTIELASLPRALVLIEQVREN